MHRDKKNQGGQALLMVTMGLFAMCGLMGLAIDLGWSFYVHKTARAAADSAALAAVKAAFESLPKKDASFIKCGAGFACSGDNALVPCSAATDNLSIGCQFAQKNGFTSGGNNGRQTLRIGANVSATGCTPNSPPICIPTAPGVVAFYWVHVVATETIPQLFSAIYGNTSAVVSADATAALANVVVPGSVYATNRLPSESFLYSGHPGPQNDAGVDIALSHGSKINAPGGGIFLASNCPADADACDGAQYAGAGQQVGSVDGITYLRAGGDAQWCGSDTSGGCQKGAPASMFGDPYSGLGQPPIHPASLFKAVPNGILTPVTCGGACPSGNYYSVDKNGNATGKPVQIAPGVTFAGGNFGTFLFMGGVTLNGSANGGPGAVNLGPGEYVAVGVDPALGNGNQGVNQGGNALAIDLSNGGITGGNGSDAGRLFISTNLNYPGFNQPIPGTGGFTLASKLNIGTNVPWDSNNFKFGEVTMPSNMANSWYGLNPDSSSLPEDLKPFGPLAFWQDQQNSKVEYDVNGNVMNSTSCGGDGGDVACLRDLNQGLGKQVSGKIQEPQFRIFKQQSPASSGDLNIHGVIYQPRGGSMKFNADVIFNSDSTLVSGTIDIGGPGTILNLPRASRIPLTILRPVMVH